MSNQKSEKSSIAFEDVIASPTFEFLVGAEKKSFVVHQSLVSHHSEPLKAMMTGSMVEAKSRCAALPDVDLSTFVRFAQFIYTDDYSMPAPTILDDSSLNSQSHENGFKTSMTTGLFPPTKLSAAVTAPDPLDSWPFYASQTASTDGWGFGTANKKSKKASRLSSFDEPESQTKSGKPDQLELGRLFVTACDEMKEQLPRQRQAYTVYRNQDSGEEMTEILLGHAQLYVFGDTYGIKDLTILAAYRLRQSLCALRLYPCRITDLVALIRYCYENTPENDTLRQLVVDYSACMAKYLTRHQDFTALTAENGAFSSDLLMKIMEQLD